MTTYSPPIATYTPLQTITLGSSASSVTFANIPNTYRDLVLIVDGTGSLNDSIFLQFNSDTGSNYSRVLMQGNGSTTSSSTETLGRLRIGELYTTRSLTRTQIMDYSATDKHKTVLSRTDIASTKTWALAGRWANTSAITTIKVIPEPGGMTLSSGTTLSLYGIA